MPAPVLGAILDNSPLFLDGGIEWEAVLPVTDYTSIGYVDVSDNVAVSVSGRKLKIRQADRVSGNAAQAITISVWAANAEGMTAGSIAMNFRASSTLTFTATVSGEVITTSVPHTVSVGDRVRFDAFGGVAEATIAASIGVTTLSRWFHVMAVASTTTLRVALTPTVTTPPANVTWPAGTTMTNGSIQLTRLHQNLISPEKVTGTVGAAFTHTVLLDAGVGSIYTFNGTIATSVQARYLPNGLSIDSGTRIISGTPTKAGSYFVEIIDRDGLGYRRYLLIEITGSNGSVSGSIPVIDSALTSGRAVTAFVGEGFTFQPSATNSPTLWAATAMPPGLSFSAVTGALTGAFSGGGLYAVAFIASNSFGASAPVTINFSATLHENDTPSGVQDAVGGVDCYVDIQTRAVSFSFPVAPTQQVLDPGQTVQNAPTPAKEFITKRGDTAAINVHFMRGNSAVAIVPDTLKFAARIKDDFFGEYILQQAVFTAIPGAVGTYRIIPDFSAASIEAELDVPSDDFSKLELMAEFQWTTATPATRCSSETFPTIVLRDLVNPD